MNIPPAKQPSIQLFGEAKLDLAPRSARSSSGAKVIEAALRAGNAEPILTKAANVHALSNENMSLIAFQNETFNLALLVAITLNSINAIRLAAPLEIRPYHLHFVPAFPAVLPAAVMGLLDIDISQDTLDNTALLLARLGASKQLLSKLYPHGSARRSCTQDQYALLSESWSEAAMLAKTIVKALSCNGAVGLQNTQLNFAQLAGLLEQVCRGESPCMVLGRPKMPAWARDRLHQRRILNVCARADFGIATSNIFVRDVSRGGCGIHHNGEIRSGQKFVIELAGGRRLPARIVWSREGRAGAQFDAELPHCDPFFGH